MEKDFKKFNTGFTIIETMIAISLFLVIMMSGMGALLNANLIHNKSKDMRSIIDSLSFIIDDISRNIRTGYNYRCYSISGEKINSSTISEPRDCVGGGWGIAFESATGLLENNNDQWVYYIGPDYNMPPNFPVGIFKSTFRATSGPLAFSDFVKLNPDEVVIENSRFTVVNSLLNDNAQPFVTINLSGKITYKNITTPFSMQTSVSQRLIDISGSMAALHPPNNPAYTFCAKEGSSCSFTGIGTVAYGANSSFFYKNNINSNIDCNNMIFGDPINGVGKSCYYKLNE